MYPVSLSHSIHNVNNKVLRERENHSHKKIIIRKCFDGLRTAVGHCNFTLTRPFEQGEFWLKNRPKKKWISVKKRRPMLCGVQVDNVSGIWNHSTLNAIHGTEFMETSLPANVNRPEMCIMVWLIRCAHCTRRNSNVIMNSKKTGNSKWLIFVQEV